MHKAIMANTKLQILESFTINMPLRKEMFEDREHLVAPVIAIVEGVHNGLYYPEEEIGKFAEAWNGIPLLVGHPKDVDGHSVSANTPEIIEENAVGRFFNVYMEEGKLKGEIWLDVKKTKEVNPAVLDIINGDGQLEVSTGLWTEDENTSGEWKGEKYEAIMRGHRPDHLALLPGGEGACNWEDGCGVRVNTKEGGEEVDDKELFEKLEAEGKKSGEAPNKFKLMFIKLANKLGYKTSEVSHNEIYGRLSDMIGSSNMEVGSKGPYRYVNSVFDNYFIYEEHMEGEASKLFRQDYRINADDEIKFVDEPVQVKKEIKYVKLSTEKGGTKTMEKNENCCKELIDSLIANDAVQFVEDDRKWLETLEEDQLKKFEPVVDEDAVAKAKRDQDLAIQAAKEEGIAEGKALKDNEPNPNANPDSKPGGESTPDPQTAEEFIENAPEGIRETLQRSYKRDQELKANLVKSLLAIKRNTFTEEQLNSKTMDELESLAKLADVPADYSGKGGAPVENEVKDNERHEDGTGVPDMPTLQLGNSANV